MEECSKKPYTERQKSECQCIDPSVNEAEPEIIIHPATELPIPYGIKEKSDEIVFLNPLIGEGKRIVNEKGTTVPTLFSLIRQFVRPVCHSIGIITDEIMKKGINVNDVDSATGMSMLHYAVRATSLSEKSGLAVVKKLLASGADPRQRCLYSGMNALHVAIYFDVESVVKLLLKPCNMWPLVSIDSLCDGFEFGTSLHIAASNLSFKIVKVLLEMGANPTIKDDLKRTPIECLPTNFVSEDDHLHAKQIRQMLSKPVDSNSFKSDHSPRDDLVIGSKVAFSYNQTDESNNTHIVRKTGTLRFIGKLPQRPGDWAGIALATPDGDNSGRIGEEFYFLCKPNHGVFVQLSMVTPVITNDRESLRGSVKKEAQGKAKKCPYKVGDRVLVAGTMEGTVRFVGKAQFASGIWCGLELDSSGPGRNNGSVGGVSYFTCPPARGVFSPPSKLKLIETDRSSSRSEPAGEQMTSRHRDSYKFQDQSSLASYPDTTASYPVSPRIKQVRFRNPSNNFPHLSVSDKRITYSATDRSYLHPGMRVNVRDARRSGVIKFVGETEFASGCWVGLDLGVACGRNDGSVRGHRYFRCPPKHGLMVRPDRVTYKGINGASLLPPNLEMRHDS